MGEGSSRFIDDNDLFYFLSSSSYKHFLTT